MDLPFNRNVCTGGVYADTNEGVLFCRGQRTLGNFTVVRSEGDG